MATNTADAYASLYATNAQKIDELQKNAQNAMEDLKAASVGYNQINYTPDAYTALQFDPGSPKEIRFESPVSLSSILNRVDTWLGDLRNIKPLVLPDDPGSKQMEDHAVWNESLLTQIESSISGYIDSMGIPDAKYQNAIFNEDYDRNLVILNDLYDLADAKTGARGFTYTNDYGNALKIDAQVKYQFDRTQVSRNISKLITEWARQNYQFAIEKGISEQQIQMDFTYKYCTAFFTIYKDRIVALVEGYKARVQTLLEPVEALIKEYNAAIEYAKSKAEIDKTNETLKQTHAEIRIKEGLSKYGSDTSRLTSELQQRLESLRAISNHMMSLANTTTQTVIGIAKP